MHPNLAKFIMGIRQGQPDFTWQPSPMHDQLATVLPAPAVYGLFRDAWQVEDRVFIPDPDLMRNVQRIAADVQRALGGVVIERGF
jgi:hypothetical protein